MTVIELGELSSSPGDSPVEPPATGPDRRVVRQAALLLAGLLTVFAVTGSAVPESRGPRSLWSVPVGDGDASAIAGDVVYLRDDTPRGVRLTARPLATGAVRWTTELTEQVGHVQPVPAAGVVLVLIDHHAVARLEGNTQLITADFHRRTIALDAATGAVRWRAAGQPNGWTRHGLLLEEHADDGTLSRIRLVRPADGGTVWSRETPGAAYRTLATRDGVPDRFVTATAAGTVAVHRFADGTLVGRARVRWTKPRVEDGIDNSLEARDGLLAVNRGRSDEPVVDVYRLDTLARLWSSTDKDGYAYFCGAGRLCLNTRNAVVARDAATGRRLWEVGNVALAPVGDDRLLVGDDGGETSRSVLIDAATGRPLGEPARGTTVWSTEVPQTGSLLLMNPTVDPPGRTSVTRWDLRTGRQRLLGSTEFQTGHRCEASGRYLACYRGNDMYVLAVE